MGNPSRNQSFAELTRTVLGRAMTVDAVFRLLDALSGADENPGTAFDGDCVAPLWVGSIGYERYRLNTDFAEKLSEAGIDCVIDVRQLPISRRRGYAKSALSAALGKAGIEYVHMRALGNPKPTRDLYKSGSVEAGRIGYEQYLLTEQRVALDDLLEILREKRCALMCVEHDPAVCHRSVIISALGDQLSVDVVVAELG